VDLDFTDHTSIAARLNLLPKVQLKAVRLGWLIVCPRAPLRQPWGLGLAPAIPRQPSTASQKQIERLNLEPPAQGTAKSGAEDARAALSQTDH
jgi:hypothetical protein